MNAKIQSSIIRLLYHEKLKPIIPSRNTVSPFKTKVADFGNLSRDYLIPIAWVTATLTTLNDLWSILTAHEC